MSKGKQPKKTVKHKSARVPGAISPVKPLSTTGKIIYAISGKRIQLLLIVAIIVSFYGNSINNDFAQDDVQFYSQNQFVQKGLAGIHDLFTKESMYGYYGHVTPASGTCWRPLTVITFALEKEYTGADPHVSHFINMILLLITAVIMLFFLRRYIFIGSSAMAFMAVLLFIIHPIHTEAVSHIKCRDELLSWLFLLLTLYCSLNFLATRNYWQLLLSMVCYFIALLSKEYGVTFIAILPLTFYFFTKEKFRVIALTTLSFIAVLVVYALIRFSYVPVVSQPGDDVLFAPYLYATPVQRLATELMVLGKYIVLLFWPNPLSMDYSYNQVPYVTFSDWRVWLSVIVQAALVIYALLKLKEKNIVSYGILFYFCSIFIVSNIVINVDSIIGERFLYQPSFGFCIAIVAAGSELLGKIKFKNPKEKFSIAFVLIMAVVLLSGFQTTRRNAEWNNDRLLWSSDVRKAPNSLLAHENLGNDFLADAESAPSPQQRSAYFNTALNEFDTALKILPTYPINLYNMGYLYLQMGNNGEAEKSYRKCIDVDSTYSKAYDGLGTIYFNEKDYEPALINFKKCIHFDSSDANDYGNIGACYQMLGQNEKAILYYKKSLRLDSTQQNVKKNLAGVESLIKNK